MKEQHPLKSVTLTIQPDSLHLFTTVLQAGVEIKTPLNTEIGTFLCQLPGFSPEYIHGTIETIFLNGTPVDDLNLHITGEHPVLALSAAMPGLAGAIFRKNSIHAALRTQAPVQPLTDSKENNLTVTLKLFNSIAKERGEDLLQAGTELSTSKLLTFLSKRSGLCENITDIEIDNNTVQLTNLSDSLDGCQTIHLKIIKSND
jgi:hypothetical protein